MRQSFTALDLGGRHLACWECQQSEYVNSFLWGCSSRIQHTLENLRCATFCNKSLSAEVKQRPRPDPWAVLRHLEKKRRLPSSTQHEIPRSQTTFILIMSMIFTHLSDFLLSSEVNKEIQWNFIFCARASRQFVDMGPTNARLHHVQPAFQLHGYGLEREINVTLAWSQHSKHAYLCIDIDTTDVFTIYWTSIIESYGITRWYFTGLATVYYSTVFPYGSQRPCRIFHNSPYHKSQHTTNKKPFPTSTRAGWVPRTKWPQKRDSKLNCHSSRVFRMLLTMKSYEIILKGFHTCSKRKKVPGWHVCGQTIPVISLEVLS